jgi:starch phosphorylase
MTTFSLRMSRSANGVSRRHGASRARDVAGAVARAGARGGADHACHQRRAFAELGRGSDACLLDRHLGEDWRRSASEPATWEALDAVPDAELWEARREQRSELVQFVQERQRDRPACRVPATCGDRGGRPRV